LATGIIFNLPAGVRWKCSPLWDFHTSKWWANNDPN